MKWDIGSTLLTPTRLRDVRIHGLDDTAVVEAGSDRATDDGNTARDGGVNHLGPQTAERSPQRSPGPGSDAERHARKPRRHLNHGDNRHVPTQTLRKPPHVTIHATARRASRFDR